MQRGLRFASGALRPSVAVPSWRTLGAQPPSAALPAPGLGQTGPALPLGPAQADQNAAAALRRDLFLPHWHIPQPAGQAAPILRRVAETGHTASPTDQAGHLFQPAEPEHQPPPLRAWMPLLATCGSARLPAGQGCVACRPQVPQQPQGQMTAWQMLPVPPKLWRAPPSELQWNRQTPALPGCVPSVPAVVARSVSFEPCRLCTPLLAPHAANVALSPAPAADYTEQRSRWTARGL